MTVLVSAVLISIAVAVLRIAGGGDDAADLVFGRDGDPAPTAQPTALMPTLTQEEAIGLIRQRDTNLLYDRQPTTWGTGRYLEVCFVAYYLLDYIRMLDAGETPDRFPAFEWRASFDSTGRWTVELLCEEMSGDMVVAATWTVDDASLRIIAVGGQAD